MMTTQTFIKTLFCVMLSVSVSASANSTSKAVSKPQHLWSPPTPTISKDELQKSLDKIRGEFAKAPLETLSAQMKQLETIVNEYIGWEQTTRITDDEYQLRIVPYVKIMACLQRSNNTYITWFKEKYESKLQLYYKLGSKFCKRAGKILKKGIKGEWVSAVWEFFKCLPGIWSRYKITFKDGKLEEFRKNRADPGPFEKALAFAATVQFTLIEDNLREFMTEFKAGITSLRLFFLSLQKMEQQKYIKKILDEAESFTKSENLDDENMFVENNERLIQVLKTNLDFSRTQYGLSRKAKAIEAKEDGPIVIVDDLTEFERIMTNKKLAFKLVGTKIYHSIYETGTIVGTKNDNTMVCLFDRFGKEKKFEIPKSDLSKILDNIESMKTDFDVKFPTKEFGFTHGATVDNYNELYTEIYDKRVDVVKKDSFADKHGVSVGNQITKINGECITGDSVAKIIEDAKAKAHYPITITFDAGSTRTVSHVNIKLEGGEKLAISVRLVKVVPSMTINGIFKGIFGATLNTSHAFQEYIRAHGGAAMGTKLIDRFCETVATTRSQLLLETANTLNEVEATTWETKMCTLEFSPEQEDGEYKLDDKAMKTKLDELFKLMKKTEQTPAEQIKVKCMILTKEERKRAMEMEKQEKQDALAPLPVPGRSTVTRHKTRPRSTGFSMENPALPQNRGRLSQRLKAMADKAKHLISNSTTWEQSNC